MLKKPSYLEWGFFFLHLICLLFGFGLASYVIIFCTSIYCLFAILKRSYFSLYLLLIFGSYHSMFNNIYTSDIFGINIIYILIVTYFFTTLIYFKFNIKTILISTPFIFMYLLNLIFGFYYKYSVNWYLNELFSFTCLSIFIINIFNLSYEKFQKIINILANYVLYFYPLFTFFSIISANEENLYFDEFEKFYYVSIIPIMFMKFKNKKILIPFHILVFILKSQFTYTSSLNIILLVISALTLFFLSNFNIARKFIFILLISLLSILVYNYSSPLTKFKVFQAQEAIAKIIEGDVTMVPKSPRVRVLEFMISFNNLKEENIIVVLVGKGFGSYIDDNRTQYFKKFKTPLNDDDYSKEEVDSLKFKKGHGGIPYIPIKMGIFGMILFVSIFTTGLTLIKNKEFSWLAIGAPFYIVTTFSFGLKNFIFVGILVGIILALRFRNKQLIS